MAGVEGARLLPLPPMGILLHKRRSRRGRSKSSRSRRNRRPYQRRNLLHDGVERLLLLPRRRERGRRRSDLCLLGGRRHVGPSRRGRRVGLHMEEEEEEEK